MPASRTTAATAEPRSPSSSMVGASSAIPSETSSCGVGISTRLSSSSPRTRTSSWSLTARSAWWPGYVSWLVRRNRQTDVQGDVAAQVAEVLAGAQPRLVAQGLHDDPFVVGQRDETPRPRTRLVDD